MIHAKVEEFKEKYKITSDRALISWSGMSLKDIAKKVDRKLLECYETTFRLCSRFSHPSILGDNEYLIQKDKSLAFSPLPSTVYSSSSLVTETGSRWVMKFLRCWSAAESTISIAS